ncbi:MAG TPA: hypothetical protein VLK84_11250 [Longimicrobium sp.]|nr:hypothetical protein [Longimicrobium sp.]
MDIRLVRGRESRVWLTVALLAGGGIVLLIAVAVFGGDATMGAKRQVGAAANFGANRAPVLPMETQAFETLLPLDNRELGRLVHLRATAESVTRGHAVWVRTPTGRRILVRFEPEPPAGALRALGPGSVLDVNGYVQKISRAEFDMWTDSLNVAIPRPRPGTKFGDLPDSGFAKIDSLFIKNYYVSVRPEGLRDSRSTASLRPDTTLTPYRDTTALGRFRADSVARAARAADSAATPRAPRTDSVAAAPTP